MNKIDANLKGILTFFLQLVNKMVTMATILYEINANFFKSTKQPCSTTLENFIYISLEIKILCIDEELMSSKCDFPKTIQHRCSLNLITIYLPTQKK